MKFGAIQLVIVWRKMFLYTSWAISINIYHTDTATATVLIIIIILYYVIIIYNIYFIIPL